MKQKVHLVLGSGGARGITHIGVIDLLHSLNFEIVSVTGCSMGAVVGGMYCAGYLDAYKEWLLSLTKSKLFSLFDFTLNTKGFIKGEKVLNQLQEFTGDQNIEGFAIKFTAVATDIINRKEVHYNNGNLYKALRASIGIPGVFTPVAENDTFMVDGGVLNPLPVNLVCDIKPNEKVIAVNLNAAPLNKEIKKEEDTQDIHKADAWNMFLNFKLSMPTFSKKKETTIPDFTILDLVNTAYDFTQDRLVELMLQNHPPDILIEIPRNVCGTFDFHKAADLIAIGNKIAAECIEKHFDTTAL